MIFCSDISLIRVTVLVLIILFVFGLLTYSEIFKIASVKEESTLVIAHVFFRNGESVIQNERNPFSQDIPCTSSELTNEGTSMMFEMGFELRRNYLHFIGKEYSDASIDLTCLNTKVFEDSLILTLAGLFPLRGSKTKPSGLSQQNISIKLINITESLVLFLPNSCPKFNQLYNEVIKQEKYVNLTKEYDTYFDNIRNETTNLPTILAAFLLNYNIESGLKPFDWKKEVYPHPTKLLSDVYLDMISSKHEMKQILAGPLINKIINDTVERIKGTTETKMHLYSVEKYNIEYLIKTLGIIGVDEIEKGSYISFEVHKFEGNFFLKVIFMKSLKQKVTVLELPYCGKICPLHYFIEKNHKYLPTATMCHLQSQEIF